MERFYTSRTKKNREMEDFCNKYPSKYFKSVILVRIKALIQSAFVISDFHRDLDDIWAIL